MSSSTLTIETFWGPLELRVSQSRGEPKEAFPFEVHGPYLSACVRGAFEKSPLRARRLADDVAWRLSVAPEDPLGVLLSALRDGLLIAATSGDTADADSQGIDGQAFRALRARLGPVFHLGMRRHRLVPRDQVESVRASDDYDVVPATEAASALLRMAEATADPKLVSHAGTLAAYLRDLRSPAASEGYVLLRAATKLAIAARESADVVTPAQLKKLAAKNWLEVVVFGRDGKAMPNVTLEITLPNGGVETQVTPANGKVRLDAIFESGAGHIAIVQVGKWVIRREAP